MGKQELIDTMTAEIERLQTDLNQITQARELLQGEGGSVPAAGRRAQRRARSADRPARQRRSAGRIQEDVPETPAAATNTQEMAPSLTPARARRPRHATPPTDAAEAAAVASGSTERERLN